MNRPNWRWVVLATTLALGTEAAAQKTRNESLVDRAGWARLVVKEGRITALPVGTRDSRSTTCNNPQTSASESLSVSIEAGRADLRYQFADDTQQLTVDITRSDTVSIHREPRGGAAVAAVHFTQARSGLSLEVDDQAGRRHVVAANLWELLIAHRELTSEHLVPILESLESDWMLDETARRAEQSLLRAADDLPAKRRQCLELVERLSSPIFEQRRSAYQKLAALGPSAVALLGDLDQYDFDAEQRQRLRAINGTLDAGRSDTPQTIAALVIDDADVWLTLLERDDLQVRRVAATQLSRIRGATVEFDPDADGNTRQAQIERLRQRLERGR